MPQGLEGDVAVALLEAAGPWRVDEDDPVPEDCGVALHHDGPGRRDVFRTRA